MRGNTAAKLLGVFLLVACAFQRCETDAQGQQCQNISGTWDVQESVTLSCSGSFGSGTQTKNGNASINLTQNGCNISYVGPLNTPRTGTVSGYNIRLSGIVAKALSSSVVIDQNYINFTGTISQNLLSIHTTGAGLVRGSVSGVPGSCTASSTETFTRPFVPLQVTTTTLPNATSGQAYTATIIATGGSGTYTWSVSSGALPTGFSLSSAGVLSSTGSPPDPADSYSFTVQVADSDGNLTTQPLTLAVNCQGTPATVILEPAEEYMWAKFVAPDNKTLSDYAIACGFDHFNWQQLITTLPSGYFTPNVPSAVSYNINALDGTLYAPPAFLDPPSGGYTYMPSGDDPWPFYYLSNQVATPPPLYCTLLHGQCPPLPYIVSPDDTTLWFEDDPALPGNPPNGAFIAFETSLVGVDNQGNAHIVYSWTWESTFNGTANEVAQTASIYPIDTGSGTGGVTVTSINGVPVQQHTLSLSSGWNLISLPLQPVDTTISSVLLGVAGAYQIVWGYPSMGWQFYDPNDQTDSKLAAMAAGNGYWINMASPQTLTVLGSTPPSSLPLVQGWNLVGYNGTSCAAAMKALSSLGSALQVSWSYVGQAWQVYDPNDPAGSTLSRFCPNNGYWIKVNKAKTWTLPSN